MQIKLVNIRPPDIVDGNSTITLGLIWMLILHYQVEESAVRLLLVLFVFYHRRSKTLVGMMMAIRRAIVSKRKKHCSNGFARKPTGSSVIDLHIHERKPDFLPLDFRQARNSFGEIDLVPSRRARQSVLGTSMAWTFETLRRAGAMVWHSTRSSMPFVLISSIFRASSAWMYAND